MSNKRSLLSGRTTRSNRSKSKGRDALDLRIESLEPRMMLSASPNDPADTVLAWEPASENVYAETSLDQQALERLVGSARALWEEAGASAEQLAVLDSAEYRIAALAGVSLGTAEGNVVTIDVDAASLGWFIDATPFDHSEFELSAQGTYSATASMGVDLLSIVMHEQGHLLGLDDVYDAEQENDLMFGVFTAGERRLAEYGQADGSVAGSLEGVHYATAYWDGADVDRDLFQLDFDNNITDPTQAGWESFSKSGDANNKSVSYSGYTGLASGDITITTSGVEFTRNYDNGGSAAPDFPGTDFDNLYNDLILRNDLDNPLDITISGLAAGTYQITTHHHLFANADSDVSEFDLLVQDATAATASFATAWQSTIASEQHPDYPDEARYYHVSVNPNNPGIGSFAATIPGTNNRAGTFTRSFTDPVVAYSFLGGTNSSISGIVAQSGGRISWTTDDTVFDGFGQGQLKLWTTTDPGEDIATSGADPFNVNTNNGGGGGYRSFGGAVTTVDISGLASGSVYAFYGAFNSTPTLTAVMRDSSGTAPDVVLPNAHLNGDFANRTEYYAAELAFETGGVYDQIVYTWLANGTDYEGNGRGAGAVLTGTAFRSVGNFAMGKSAVGPTTPVFNVISNGTDPIVLRIDGTSLGSGGVQGWIGINGLEIEEVPTVAADGGDGTWTNTTVPNWDTAATAGTSVHWDSDDSNDDVAVFGGTVGTVTIDASGVTAGGLQFATAGYVIEGGLLTLTGNATIQNDVTATISANVTATGGVAKNGTGTLFLNGTNTFTGDTTINDGTLGGSGTINTSSVTVEADGHLAPGAADGVVGTLTINGNLNISALAGGAGTLKFDIGADPASSDRIVTLGTVDIGTGAFDLDDIDYSVSGSLNAGKYTLIDANAVNGSLGSNTTTMVGDLRVTLSIENGDVVLKALLFEAVDDDFTATVTVTEEESVTIPASGVLANDFLSPGTQLLPLNTMSLRGASVILYADGSFTYDPTGSTQLQSLAAGQTVTDTFTYTLQGADSTTDTATVSITVTGLNDAPTFPEGSATTNLTETNSGLTASGTLLVSDVDVTDVVSAAVTGVSVGGSGSASVPATLTNADLLSMLSVSPDPVISGSNASGTLTWNFDSGSQAFDFLSVGQELVLTYTVQATDDSGEANNSATATVTVIITGSNDAPSDLVLSIDPPFVEAGGTVSLNGSFSDPDMGDSYTVTVDWGDGSPNTVVNISGTASFSGLTHTYGSGNGSFVITVTVDDAGFQTSATIQTFVGFGLTPDPFEDGQQALVVVGGAGNDQFTLQQYPDGSVRLLKRSPAGALNVLGVFSPDERIFVLAGAGDDVVNAVGVTYDLIVLGGDGNDRITGGLGNDLLLGGNGNDLITGGAGGRDIVIGGRGQDVLSDSTGGFSDGEAESDLLVAGVVDGAEDLDVLRDIYRTWTNQEQRGDLATSGQRQLALRDSFINGSTTTDDNEFDILRSHRGTDNVIWYGVGDQVERNTATSEVFLEGSGPVDLSGRSFLLAAAQTGSSIVQIVDGTSGEVLTSLDPFPGSDGISVAVGDVTGDDIDDYILGAGKGVNAEVVVINGATQAVNARYVAFNGFTGGVYVAIGDVDRDGENDIIVAAGAGGGPHVKVFSGANGSEIRSFFAYDAGFSGGVSVAAGDVNNDGWADIITGAGAGGGPHVKVFSGADGSELASFFAYDPAFSGGVSVAAGDLDRDNLADIVTGAGAGGGPHVKVFSGANGSELASFFAYDPGFSGGVNVAVSDANGDGLLDVVTGAGPGGGPHVRAFSGVSSVEVASFFALPPSFTCGVRAAGNPQLVGSPLRVAGGAISSDVASLTQANLSPAVRSAINLWAAAGANAEQLSALSRVSIGIANLPGDLLGLATSQRITIDTNAAGYGWNFSDTNDTTFSGVDLVTVLSHEMGHVLGLDDLPGVGSDLLNGVLRPGERKVPTANL
jgi:VCBS repeat-containing protein/autotransporter-associated beta strand protein